MEGYLEKLSSGLVTSYQKRYFRLKNQYLCYYEKPTDFKPKKAMVCVSVSLCLTHYSSLVLTH
jgi:hypothetical protein